MPWGHAPVNSTANQPIRASTEVLLAVFRSMVRVCVTPHVRRSVWNTFGGDRGPRSGFDSGRRIVCFAA